MILSKRHNFIFIKGMKVAGTSVEMALSALCGPDDIITPLSQIDELERLKFGRGCQNFAATRAEEEDYLKRLTSASQDALGTVQQPAKLYFNHMSLAAVAQTYAHPLSSFQVLCVERSPYAKVISWANMQLSYDAYRVGGAMEGDPAALKSAVDRGFATGDLRHVRNIDRYRMPDGRLAATPMRYSHLAEDFAGVVRAWGVNPPSLPHAKKGLMSDRFDPRDILRADQIERINKLFSDEFAAFGYARL